MLDGYSLWGIILFIVFLILDGVLLGFAAASSQVNMGDWNKRCEDGEHRARMVLEILNNSIRLHDTIQIAAMIMNIVVGGYILNVLNNAMETVWGEVSYMPFLSAVILMLLVAVFGIIIPFKLAMLYPDKMVENCLGIIRFIMLILTPVIFVVTVIGNGVLRLFGVNPNLDLDNVTEEEILTMVNEGHEQGVLEDNEAEMISNIFEFDDKSAVDIMTHRTNIVAVDGEMTLEEAVSFMLHENNSRYPVYVGDINNIIGIVHIKDALKEYGNRAKSEEQIKNIPELLYEAVIIPGTRNINDLFKSMQKEKVHMVIVMDEYGQTDGLVTMEDILEEIVGNILDEHDEEESQIKLQEDNSYVVDGMTMLEDLEEELSISFQTEDINTLNGFLMLKTGKIPSESLIGAVVEFAGYRFTIESVEGRLIKDVSVVPMEKKENNEEKIGE